MSFLKRSVLLGTALAGVALAGCGSQSFPPISNSGRLESVPGNPRGRIVLSALGASRIGLQTTAARGPAGAKAKGTTIPYSAVIYNYSGQTFAFKQIGALTYTEVPISVANIVGNTVHVTSGLTRGTSVVTQGAEELYGIQAGLLAET